MGNWFSRSDGSSTDLDEVSDVALNSESEKSLLDEKTKQPNNKTKPLKNPSSKKKSSSVYIIAGVVAFFIVCIIITLVVLGFMGKLSSADVVCQIGQELITAPDGTKQCKNLPSCSASQDLVNGQCVPKCGNGMVRLENKTCECSAGTSGTNCMIVDKLPDGTVVTTDNGYSVCKENGLVWNGYKCLDTNKITSCLLSPRPSELGCRGYNNTYYIQNSTSSDPYQCYNGTETVGGKVFGESGSYAEPTDRCMFGVGGATSQSACMALKTALKC